MRTCLSILIYFAALPAVAQCIQSSVYRHVFIGAVPGGDTVYSTIDVQLARTTHPDTAVAFAIDRSVQQHVIDRLGGSATDLLEACTIFERECRQAWVEPFSGGCDFYASSTEIYRDAHLVCMEVDDEVYTGGAHPSHSFTLYSFDAATGRETGWSQWIADTTAFKVVAEKYFWTTVKEELGDAVQPEDFFWGNEFFLPTNIGRVEDGVIIIYNEYEVLPYVYGPLFITVPLAEIAHTLRKP